MVVRNLAFDAASLRDARWAAGLSVAGLAAVLGVSVAAVKS